MPKTQRDTRWRDAWQIEGAIGRYIISGWPMTEEEWVCERAVMIDVTLKKPDTHLGDTSSKLSGAFRPTIRRPMADEIGASFKRADPLWSEMGLPGSAEQVPIAVSRRWLAPS